MLQTVDFSFFGYLGWRQEASLLPSSGLLHAGIDGIATQPCLGWRGGQRRQVIQYFHKCDEIHNT